MFTFFYANRFIITSIFPLSFVTTITSERASESATTGSLRISGVMALGHVGGGIVFFYVRANAVDEPCGFFFFISSADSRAGAECNINTLSTREDSRMRLIRIKAREWRIEIF